MSFLLVSLVSALVRRDVESGVHCNSSKIESELCSLMCDLEICGLSVQTKKVDNF